MKQEILRRDAPQNDSFSLSQIHAVIMGSLRHPEHTRSPLVHSVCYPEHSLCHPERSEGSQTKKSIMTSTQSTLGILNILCHPEHTLCHPEHSEGSQTKANTVNHA